MQIADTGELEIKNKCTKGYLLIELMIKKTSSDTFYEKKKQLT